MINKVAMITIVGRANSGKSTLTNKLTGDKVAIVSPKPQTTRNRIFGVFTHNDTQMILLDTPGFHKAKTRLGDYMVGVVKESVADVDAVVLLVEPVDNIGTQEEMLIEHIKKSNVPAILVINKIDTIKPDLTLPIIERYSRHYNFDAIVPVSAKKGDGIPELLEIFEKYAKQGSQLFPDGMTTDQPERQIIAEIIREKLLICLDKEIPHGTAVEIALFSERGEEENPIIDVDATIYCEKSSHKGMIIGKNGAMLKKIGQYAREDIERFMGAKVFLQTWVKVKENWRDSQTMMKNFGYVK
ncbi:MAG: GTPase Era [Oscillospiraceae bacterium]|nr:GTPase Era [Oscillospiraceae bacterium]